MNKEKTDFFGAGFCPFDDYYLLIMRRPIVCILLCCLLFSAGCETRIQPQPTTEESPEPQPVQTPAEESHAQHIEKRTEYKYCTVILDFDLPQAESSYALYKAELHGITGAEYAGILNALSRGQQWETALGKKIDTEHLGRGSFQVIRPAGDGVPRASLRGNAGGSQFLFTSKSSGEMVLSASDLNPYDADDRLLAQALGKIPAVSQADAQQIADACISDMGCFSNYRLLRGERALSVDTLFWEVTSDGWMFTYTPSFDGLQTVSESEWALRRGSDPTQTAPWTPMEALRIYVEQDITYMQLSNLTDYAEQKHAEVLPDSEIINVIDELLYDQFEHQIDGLNKVVIKVTHVAPIYAVVQTAQGDANAIPCWEIRFTEQYLLDSGALTDDEDEEPIYISAVDGSYIEPRATAEQMVSPEVGSDSDAD